MLNKTNAVETNESTENSTQKIFSDEQTIKQLNSTQQVVVATNFPQQAKSIRFIEYHSIEVFKETKKIGRNLKENTPSITLSLKIIQIYIHHILKETRQIQQIVDDMSNTTNAPETDTSFTEITLEQAQQIFEQIHTK